MIEHTLKFFGEELNQIKAEVARMGGLAEAQVVEAVAAVAARDVALAQTVVARDTKLDQMQLDIERKVLRMIALRQPVAQDLRRTVGAMKMSWNLERTGDLAKNIARRGLVIARDEPMTPLTRSMERMGKLVAARLKDALDAYSSGQLEQAMLVWSQDDEIDEHYNSLSQELLASMTSDPRTIGSCAHLLFIGKNLERIGDHATNIAEIIHYELTGAEIVGERPKWSGLDEQLTEATG